MLNWLNQLGNPLDWLIFYPIFQYYPLLVPDYWLHISLVRHTWNLEYLNYFPVLGFLTVILSWAVLLAFFILNVNNILNFTDNLASFFMEAIEAIRKSPSHHHIYYAILWTLLLKNFTWWIVLTQWMPFSNSCTPYLISFRVLKE